MQISQAVRYGVLAMAAALAAGLLWLGVVRYQAEQRALRFASLDAEAVAAVASANATPAILGEAPNAVEAPAGALGMAGPSAGRAGTPSTGPEPPPEPKLLVHVAGAVASPGVYELEPGARVMDAIEVAGGALPEGMPHSLNLAAPVSDGDKIYVYTRVELQPQAPVSPHAQGATHVPVTSVRGTAVAPPPSGAGAGGKVNVNTATAEELESIRGIGPATARAIIEYRTRNGPFRSLEDLEAVKGIGPKTLEKLRPHLTL